MAEQLSAFRRQIRCLFAEKGCLGSGYTNLALSHLRRTKLVPVPGHSPVALGGQGAVSPETVTDCLGIMVAWSRLADEVAQTEFPEHELLACFRVFNRAPLDGPKRARPSATSIVPAPVPATQQDLNRLADAFKVDSTCLLNQFREHQRIAELEFARTPGLSVATAWRCADTSQLAQEAQFPSAIPEGPVASIHGDAWLHRRHRAKLLEVQEVLG